MLFLWAIWARHETMSSFIIKHRKVEVTSEVFSQKMENPRLSNYIEEIRVDFKGRDKVPVTPIIIPEKMCNPAISNLQLETDIRVSGDNENVEMEDTRITGRQNSDVQIVNSQ